MIREGYLDSEAYASVDDLAKLVWHHMLSLADDFGCVSLAPSFVRRRLFYTQPSDATVSRVIEQLQSADLIRLYAHDDARYAFIPRFGQRLKRATLKHPQPPEALYFDDAHAKQLFKEINEESQKKAAVGREDGGSTAALGRLEEKRSRRDVEEEEKREKAPRTARGARLPPDWTPGEEGLEYCRRERPDLDPQRTFEAFRDFWSAASGQKAVKLDWAATWRTWVRNEKRGQGASNASSRFNLRESTERIVRAARGMGGQASGQASGDVWGEVLPAIPDRTR